MATEQLQVHKGDKRQVQAALRAFFALSEKWGLTREQGITLLGSPARSTYHNWKKINVTSLNHDTLERISYLLGIHKALGIIFSRNPESVFSWIHKRNNHPFFAGQSALDKMLSGNLSDLFLVRGFLDSQRGGWS